MSLNIQYCVIRLVPDFEEELGSKLATNRLSLKLRFHDGLFGIPSGVRPTKVLLSKFYELRFFSQGSIQ